MNYKKKTIEYLRQREENESSRIKFQRHFHSTNHFVERLGLETELEGHNGCVNCLEWSTDGSKLISGSDDVSIIIWDAVEHKVIKRIDTGHEGNIFSVKYVPQTNDTSIVSGAADCKIRVNDIIEDKETFFCKCHRSRVKRLATSPQIPNLFWSSSEDGLILEFDLRSPHSCTSTPSNCLINLCTHMGFTAEAKCIAINPLRPELMAVGTNDPFIRLFDRRMISKRPKVPSQEPSSSESHSPRMSSERLPNEPILDSSCATYFVPGHLPHKRPDLRTKLACKSLACTYVAFSPNGSELLANLGGEQVYLFDTFKRLPHKSFCINFKSNGFCSPITSRSNEEVPRVPSVKLPKSVEELKIRANVEFGMKHYTRAINLYNEAISLFPKGAVLYGNRASAFTKRCWDGDLYAALRDCYIALTLEHNYMKVHLKLIKILLNLKWEKEALSAFESFKIRFPDVAMASTGLELEEEINERIKFNESKAKETTKETSKYGEAKETSSSAAKEKEESKESSSSASSVSTLDPEDVADDESDEDDDEDSWVEFPNEPQIVILSEEEKFWRSHSDDFKKRFCGHCNTTTDIKEANFFGSEGQFIVAGSDDGSFFIWDKETTNIVKVMKGDDSIVNCLQPHPSICLLASSGIDPVVRLWSPRPDDGSQDERQVLNHEDVANENQKRMNSSPFEAMLLSMGYRELAAMADRRLAANSSGSDNVMHCRPS